MQHQAPAHMPQRNKRALLFVLAGLLLLGAAGLWYVKVTDVNGPSILPPCLFHSVTGLYDAGCGITRALHFILNGQFYAGFRMNPLAVLCLPFLVWILALLFYRLYRNKPLPQIAVWLPWAILAVILAYTVARNLSWEPFKWLAPTAVEWAR